jgi:Icc-related predicted phosphoesterase
VSGTIRIAAVGDVHCTKASAGTLTPLFAGMAETAEVVVLCGDLTDYGLPEEAEVLAAELRGLRADVVAVLGNHDFESAQHRAVVEILAAAGVHVLDGDAVELHGVGFAGTKGFAGGFGQRALGPWGEAAIKSFVQEALDESLKLEAALARLRTDRKVAVLHYAPVEATVRGEPEQIYAFLGSSRLEDPIDRYGAAAVLHGHAHHGTAEGATRGGVPVYNVSLPLLQREGGAGFRVIELALTDADAK